ncbi:MAG TPA: EAL domain-containing protein [Pseudomonadales bacterium]|nr:EAL domain-containing protein [Pseudomonadales bacterium]
MDGGLDSGFEGLLEGLTTAVRPATTAAPAPAESLLSVLVVDDRAELRESLCALLEDAGGYRISSAGGGLEALEVLSAEPEAIDLVLLDLVMPDCSGLEVIDRVRALGLDTRIIVVSGEPTFEHVQRALTRGAIDFIRKPYEPEELLSTIGRVRDRLVLERRAEEMERQLVRSELLHRFVVDRSPDLIYMLDGRGHFAFLNQRVETLLGFAREELLGAHYTALVPESQRAAAEYVFNERRTGDRASRDAELVLRSRVPRGPDRRGGEAPVEITSMGIWSEGADGPRRIGSYGIVRDISERKRAEELIHFQAYHDQLTQLPNRALFKDRLELAIAQAQRHDKRLAVMFLDLDRFKVVNDSLGHSFGDRLLKAVAARLKGWIRRGDTLARFGGDEFCLLLPDVKSDDDVAQIGQKFIDKLATPFLVDEHELFVGASIGIAMYPEAGESAESLIQSADIAMYHIKGRGKNGFQFFSDRMNDKYASHLSVERELRNALLADELEPHYQPQVDVETGAILGVEALARWNHPRRGMVSPAEFIPLAEETGLIIPVDRCIQRKACLDVARWRAEGHEDLSLSMNISAAQIETDDFVDWMLALFEETGVGTRGIKLEITESVIMREMDLIVPKLRKLSARGVRIGIDDFGTGYSSLSYLQNFPVDTLKIDRAFVSDIRSDESESSIVNAIIHMAKGLGMDIIAEGVESDTQLRYLHTQGCRHVQGFIFSKPLARIDLTAFLCDGRDLAAILTRELPPGVVDRPALTTLAG